MSHLNRWIGVDQGSTKMLMTAEFDGEYIDKTVPTGMRVTKEYLVEQVNTFIDDLPFTPEGIGMGVVGLVDGDTLVSSHLRNLEGMTTELFQRGDCHCYFVNDVRAAMICESEQYANDESIVLVMAGSGFAMSAREQGLHIMGKHGWAGELGSNVYPLNGELKTLNYLSGGNGILKQANCDIATLLQALDNDEEFAVNVVNRAGMYFGLALVDMMHTFNPEYIIVGGSTATFKNYMAVAQNVAKEHTYPAIYQDCSIVAPKDPKRIVALGARLFGYRKEHELVK
ncbi:ROK family protein [Bacillaceae bacterium SIJ1]|uniref:ROK family protein n=1 Tax=Litoribacterium kuwaitense TaxID=1398745 RepID=UPI0013EDB0BE|nr:ROK family protein [Litoribacterium kuwaitense]NGP44966.1 ROK family protein [Litoribacterium kuwaitense]